jgi:predicted amidohydrolase YtcJ
MTDPSGTVDLLLVNANVLTLDPRRPRATAIAISGGRIRGLPADPAQVRAARVADLGGATVIPGFHDAHNHMVAFGMSLGEVDLRSPGIADLGQLYAAVKARAAGTGDGGWVIGSGYDQNKLGGHPDRDALDLAAPGRRVWLRHTSGHMCVVNSLVLADLGLDTGRPDVRGGRIVTDGTGRPTGLLEEQAQQLVGALVSPHPVSELADAIDRAGARYLSEGITSCTEAGIGGGWIGQSPVELAAYQAARDSGRLRVRTELMIASDVLHPLDSHPGDDLELGLDLGLRTGFGDDWLRLGAMKIFTDGSLVGRTAAMHDAYSCTHRPARPDHRRAPVRLAGRRARHRGPRHRPGPGRLRRRPGPVPAARPAAPHRAFRRLPPGPGHPGRQARRDRRPAGSVRLRARRRHAGRGRPPPAELAVPPADAAAGRDDAARQLRPPRRAGRAAARDR